MKIKVSGLFPVVPKNYTSVITDFTPINYTYT